MGAGRGGQKKYRQPAVEKAIKEWKNLFGDKPFTSTDLYESGLIVFKQKNQHISKRSVSTIIGIYERKGLVRRTTDGAKKRQHEYQVV